MRALIFFALLLPLLAACGGQGMEATDLWENAVIRKAAERGKLVIATEPQFRPFEWKNDKNELVGFDVDLARIIGKELGVEVEFLEVAWTSIIPTLVGGKADLIMSGMTATPERALTVSYTDPYFHTITCLLVSTTKGADIRGIDDLNQPGRVVAVKEGTTGHFAAEKYCPKAKIVSTELENDAANEVVQGKADAFLYDLWSIRQHHKNNPDTTRVIATPVSREPYAIALRKGDPESAAWLNLVLRTLRLDGRLQELYDKYGLEDVR
ncbi:MAG: transporter substrate-binding domain-containing protein [Planctomycetota bacterium]|nr:transporter substrate-binding domain-containing protein [Planctomycetota bacterium]